METLQPANSTSLPTTTKTNRTKAELDLLLNSIININTTMGSGTNVKMQIHEHIRNTSATADNNLQIVQELLNSINNAEHKEPTTIVSQQESHTNEEPIIPQHTETPVSTSTGSNEQHTAKPTRKNKKLDDKAKQVKRAWWQFILICIITICNIWVITTNAVSEKLKQISYDEPLQFTVPPS